MRSKDREKYLLETARDVGFVSIRDAAEWADTSIETIRRDINKLAKEGKLVKVRGGLRVLERNGVIARKFALLAELEALSCKYGWK